MGLLDRIVQMQKKEGFAGDISTVVEVQIPPPHTLKFSTSQILEKKKGVEYF